VRLIWLPLTADEIRFPGAVGACVSAVVAIVVTSLAELFPELESPPPDTDAVFVTLDAAVLDTFTVNVSTG